MRRPSLEIDDGSIKTTTKICRVVKKRAKELFGLWGLAIVVTFMDDSASSNNNGSLVSVCCISSVLWTLIVIGRAAARCVAGGRGHIVSQFCTTLYGC